MTDQPATAAHPGVAMDEFFVAIPSIQGSNDWVVYQTSQLDRPLFVGAEDAAQFVAKRLQHAAMDKFISNKAWLQ